MISRGVITILAVILLTAKALAGAPPNGDFETSIHGCVWAWNLGAKRAVAIPEKGAVCSGEGVEVSWCEGSADHGKRCLKMEGSGRGESE